MAARDDRDSHNGSSQSGSGTELGIEPVADKTFNEQDVDPAAETTGKAKQASADVEPASEKINQQVAEEKTYSTWSNSQKRFLVFMSSGAAFFSPLAANIYYPVFNILADYLHVSNTLINVTVTSYMIFQGLAPTVIAGLSDGLGRRPAFIICFIVYLAANIGLALQSSYPALLILRMVQSAGSSSTVALANAVVADIATTSERGVFMSWASSGSFLGPGIGPVIGGLLAHYLSWRWVFWFLLILAGVFFVPLLLVFPETCRKIVGDGSVKPAEWNMSLMTYYHLRKQVKEAPASEKPPAKVPIKVPNPLTTLVIIFEKEVGLVLFCAAIAFAAYYALCSSIPSQFGEIYGYNDIQIGLCFIPVGVGSFVAISTVGKTVDWNYRRHAKRLGFPLVKTKQQDLSKFPIESARLEVAVPMLLIQAAVTVAYGWVTHYQTNLAGPLILLFIMTYSAAAAFTVMTVLVVDLYPESPGTASAANNLVRCWLGAGATAAIVPMIDAMGRGWASTLVGLVCFAAAPILLAVMKWGPGWREVRRIKLQEKAAKK